MSALSLPVAIDTETGGVGAQSATHALLSAGIFAPELRVPWSQAVRPEPGLLIDRGAVAVNGYDPILWEEMGAVAEGHGLVRLIDRLATIRALRRVPKVTLVAHNASHDRSFLEAALERHGLMDYWSEVVSRRWECSCAAYAFVQRTGLVPAGPASLDALTAARLGLAPGTWARKGPHTAGEDALLCWEGYRWLVEECGGAVVRECGSAGPSVAGGIDSDGAHLPESLEDWLGQGVVEVARVGDPAAAGALLHAGGVA